LIVNRLAKVQIPTFSGCVGRLPELDVMAEAMPLERQPGTIAVSGMAASWTLLVLASLFTSWIVFHQFGAYDLSPLIDLFWRMTELVS
jgi:hypothetical protein